MKILQVIASLDPAGGGPVEGLIQQGRIMADKGHEVETVSLDAPGLPLDPRFGSCAVHFLGPAVFNYRFCKQLAPWLHAYGPQFDVIVVHGLWQYPSLCVAKIARQLGLRYVVFVHGMLDPWFAKTYPLKHLKKWLYWPWAEYRTLRDADLVLFTTREEVTLARQSFWLYKVRESLVGYGVTVRDTPKEVAREAFLAQFPHLKGKRCLLFLSRLHAKKGCDLLIEAFRKIAPTDPQLHLIFAGPDQTGWAAQLKAQVVSAALTAQVTFTGMLTGLEKWGAYDASEAFVLPSHQENFGIVVAEALCSGLPVLITDKVNLWREVCDAQAGIVHPNTQAGIDRLLMDWLALSDEQRNDMSRQAFDCFRRNFDLEQVTEKLLQRLEELVDGKVFQHTYPITLG